MKLIFDNMDHISAQEGVIIP